MESMVWTDFHPDGVFEDWYEKTAGDMVQLRWCRRHLPQMGLCFKGSPVQYRIAKWLRLAYFVLPKGLSETVDGWGEHALADFQETLTLYLSTDLANLYLNVCTGFFMHFEAESYETCRLRCSRGLLCCDKKVAPWNPPFCCQKHAESSAEDVPVHPLPERRVTA